MLGYTPKVSCACPVRAGLPAQPAGQPQVFAVMAAASMDLPDHWPENVFDWGAAYPLEPAHSDAAPLKRALLEIAPETLKVRVPDMCSTVWFKKVMLLQDLSLLFTKAILTR